MADDKITLRSYRLAFELERRLHRIDRFRIPVPYGVPLAGLGYAAIIAIGLLVLSGVPVACGEDIAVVHENQRVFVVTPPETPEAEAV